MLTMRNAGGTNRVSFTVDDALTTQRTYTLPTDFPGTSGFALVSTTGGIMSWAEFSGANYYADALTYSVANQQFTIGMAGTTDIVQTGDMSSFGQSIKLSGTNAGSIDLYEAGGTELVRLQAPATVTGLGQIYTLPDAYPTSSGYALVSTTAGVMSWATNSDANYYTTSASLSAGTLTGVIAGGGSNWTADLSALTTGSLAGAANYVGYFTATNALTGTAGF